MKYLLISLWLLIALKPCAYAGNDSLLTVLNHTIHSTAQYDAEKVKQIHQLKLFFNNSAPLTVIYDRHEQIYHAYKVFNYDSAYTYAMKLISISAQMEPRYQIAARLQLSIVLLSAGLYKETWDSLSALSGQPLPADLREYYSLWDSNGKLIYKRQSAGTVKIEHHLPPGLYIVNIWSLQRNKSKKLIVQ